MKDARDGRSFGSRKINCEKQYRYDSQTEYCFIDPYHQATKNKPQKSRANPVSPVNKLPSSKSYGYYLS